MAAFQDQIRGNFCFGCGADNPDGLQLKSGWDVDDPTLSVAQWTPWPIHVAGPRHILNGGIIATLLDCHGIVTALAETYRREGREIGSEPDLWCATASLHIEYLRPAAIGSAVSLTGRTVGIEDRTATVECELHSDGKLRALATIKAVQVPESWRHGASS